MHIANDVYVPTTNQVGMYLQQTYLPLQHCLSTPVLSQKLHKKIQIVVLANTLVTTVA